MRLNFYYEFPQPPGSIYSDYSHLVSSDRLYNLLKLENPNIEFNNINSWYLNHDGIPGQKGTHCPSCKYGHFFLIIENPDNKKYFVISYWDKFKDVDEFHKWDLENCVEMFAAVGVHLNDLTYEPCGKQYTPISYMSLYKSAEDRLSQVWKNEKIIPERPFFRGYNYLFREYLRVNDNRFDIEHAKIPSHQFIDEIAKYSINIDLPSVAEISSRTSECLGLQSCMIRPKFTLKFHNPLIPNYHYAQVECDDLSNWKILADAYIDKFEEMKKDEEKARFFAINGRKWYEENSTIDAHVNILKKVIDLNKLK
jgi:hypothetical protein